MLDKEICDFMKEIELQHEQIYLVGGYVRDQFLSVQTFDLDMATSMPIKQVETLLNRLAIPITYRNEKFGTIKVNIKDQPVEITQFRFEHEYVDYRKPSRIEPISSHQLDSRRRDFTVNSLYMDRNERIDDFHGGLDDLQARTLKTVRCPHVVFKEDALRLIRFYRLMAQLDFKAEKNTLSAAKRNIELIHHLSLIQRRDEMIKLLSSHNFLKIYKSNQGEIQCIFDQANLSVKRLHPKMTWQEKLVVIYKPEKLRDLVNAWQLSKSEKNYILLLSQMYYDYQVESLESMAVDHGPTAWLLFMEFMVKYTPNFKEKKQFLMMKEKNKNPLVLAVRSKDLKSINIPANKRNQFLNYAWFSVFWNGTDNTKETLIEKIKEVQK
ncbi:hypothetical protein ERUR111494_06080 [Erysipelothrix urinaevulpis]|uniref:hypothetical protein n=1 Tax=Erysipelothrix urinaevulpis TaxID=2683717 RepID=UPI001357D9DD|nr:hypothetical protein [Erysipelothrix urinaevulpis]